MSLGHQILIVLACGGLLFYPQKKPILDSPLQGRAGCAGSLSAPVYVTVLRCGPREDRIARGARPLQRHHCCSTGYAAPDGQQVAQAIRPRAACWPGVATSGRASRPLFPPASSSKLRRAPVNSRIACSYRSRDFLFPRFGAR